MDQNLKWAKEPDLYWLQAPLLKEPKNSPLVHYPVYYHRKYKLFCLCIPTDIELSNRLLLSLPSLIAPFVNPSFSILVYVHLTDIDNRLSCTRQVDNTP